MRIFEMFPICQLLEADCHMQMQFQNEIIRPFAIREFRNELNLNFRQIPKKYYRLKKDRTCKWH